MCSNVTSCWNWIQYYRHPSILRFFGGMTPKVKKNSKMSFGIPRWDRDLHLVAKFGENRQLGSCRKVVWITAQKNSGSSGLVRSSPPFCPRLASLKTSVFAPANKTQVGLRRGPYSTANVGRVGKSLTDRCLFRSATQRASYSTLRLSL